MIFAYQPFIKGLDLALDAMETLNKEDDRYVLLVSAQEKTYHYLNSRYSKFPSWLVLLQPTDEISSIYARADIMLSASRNEGFSYCLLEAIYSGLPFVYSDIPGTSWADEMKMGVKFISENVESLAEAIKRCASEPISMEKWEQNRELVKEKYAMPAWTDRIRKEIQEILK